jgi:cell division transport system permease protein
MRLRRILAEAALGLRRNLVMSISAVLTIAVSLTFVGGAYLVKKTVDRLESDFQSDVQVQVYLDKEVSDAQRQDVQRTLSGLPLVQRVVYESKQDAYDRFIRQNPNDPSLTENVTADQLPEAFSIKLKDPTQFEVVASAATGLPGVDQVVDNRDILTPIFKILRGIRNFAIAVAGIMVITALLLISNTVRLTAFSRRREMGVMRLVGATRLYIQLPFLLEGLVVGLLGTLAAGGMLGLGKRFLIDGQVSELFASSSILTKPSWHDVFLSAGPWMLLIGLGASAVASVFTLYRYVRV